MLNRAYVRLSHFTSHYLFVKKYDLYISLSPRLYLQEATIRLMAGASPGKTQQMLDRSAVAKTNKRGIMCGKEREVYSGEREQAMALLMACRHLPTQLLASPGERSGKEDDDDDVKNVDYRDADPGSQDAGQGW